MMRITDTVKHLIIVNVILCIATLVLADRGIDISRYLALYFTDNPNFGFWQPVTSMFMHSIASPTHLTCLRCGCLVRDWKWNGARESF
jgi:membrane associated rhomboid family serine protease